MAGCSGLLALFIISVFLMIAAKEQRAKQKKALGEDARAHHRHPKDAPTTIRAPTDVQLLATCDHFIRASWKQKGDKVEGFEVTLTEEVSNINEKVTLPAAERHVIFKIDPCRRNYTFTIRAYVYWQNRRYWSEEVGETVTSFGRAPDVDGFQVQALTATSARTTWKTVHSEDIHISVCPATHPDEGCVEYTSDGDLLVYVIDNLKPATEYVLHASFSLALNGTVCKYDKSSQTVTTPPQAPPSLQARATSVREATATVVVGGPLEHEEFVRVTMMGEERIYHDRIFTLGGLVPGQKYVLQIAACVDEVTCRARTELEIITPAASPRPIIAVVETRSTSIAISWSFTETANETLINYQVGYNSAHESFYDSTSNHSYEFTSLEPNSTYTIYVEAFSVKDDGVRIGLPGFVTASTDPEKPLTQSAVAIHDITDDPILTALSTEVGSAKASSRSFVTPSTTQGNVLQRNCAWSALPALELLFVLTALGLETGDV